MQKKSKQGLHIEVRGRDRTSTVYLCQLIGDAILDAGVEKVEIVNQQGDHVRRKASTCLLDIIESYDPNFFTSKVKVLTDETYPDMPVAFDQGEEDNDE